MFNAARQFTCLLYYGITVFAISHSVPYYTTNIIKPQLFFSHKIKIIPERDKNEKEARERKRGRQKKKPKPVLATHMSQLSVARLHYHTFNEKLLRVILTNTQILY